MEKLSFRLESYEGPLDLLLTLIKKNKVNIYDIPISDILDQYIEAMNLMKEMDLEVSSEFLVLAATLLQIKSKMLVPSEDEDGEEVDPREELVNRLLEYKKFKETVPFFKENENNGSYMFFKIPDVIEKPPAKLNYASLTPENLLRAYRVSFNRLEAKLPPPVESFSGIVGHEKVSVRKKVANMWKKLFRKARMLFTELFKGVKSRPEAVASFLAVLELIKTNKIRIEGEDSSNLVIERISDEENINVDIIDE